jgi:hypothetical protein
MYCTIYSQLLSFPLSVFNHTPKKSRHNCNDTYICLLVRKYIFREDTAETRSNPQKRINRWKRGREKGTFLPRQITGISHLENDNFEILIYFGLLSVTKQHEDMDCYPAALSIGEEPEAWFEILPAFPMITLDDA